MGLVKTRRLAAMHKQERVNKSATVKGICGSFGVQVMEL